MEKVRPGQSFKVKASTWNSFIDAAEHVKMRRGGMGGEVQRKDTKSGIVVARNATGQTLEQFAAISLGDLIIKPADNEPEFRGNPPVFEAAALAAGKPFAILQRPLENEECGPAMLVGITPAKITVSNEAHKFASPGSGVLNSSNSGLAQILWKEDGTGEKWAVLQLGISEGYSGYFKVSASGISSGCAVVNDALLELPAGTFTAAEGTNFISANFSLDSSNLPVFDGFAASSAFPSPESGKLKILLATVESSNGAISAIRQQHHGAIHGWIFKDCEELEP